MGQAPSVPSWPDIKVSFDLSTEPTDQDPTGEDETVLDSIRPHIPNLVKKVLGELFMSPTTAKIPFHHLVFTNRDDEEKLTRKFKLTADQMSQLMRKRGNATWMNEIAAGGVICEVLVQAIMGGRGPTYAIEGLSTYIRIKLGLEDIREDNAARNDDLGPLEMLENSGWNKGGRGTARFIDYLENWADPKMPLFSRHLAAIIILGKATGSVEDALEKTLDKFDDTSLDEVLADYLGWLMGDGRWYVPSFVSFPIVGVKELVKVVPDLRVLASDQWRKILKLLGTSKTCHVRAIHLGLQESMDVATSNGTVEFRELMFSTTYIKELLETSSDPSRQFAGVLCHELAKVQFGNPIVPDSWVTGLADFVRMKLGLESDEWSRPWEYVGTERPWEKGFDDMAYFIDFAHLSKMLYERFLGGPLSEGLAVEVKIMEEYWVEYVVWRENQWPYPRISFNNEDSAGEKSFFLEVMANPVEEMEVIAKGLMTMLYNSPKECPRIRTITVTLRSLKSLPAYTDGSAAEKMIHISTEYVKSLKGSENAAEEILGLLWHEFALALQHDGRVNPEASPSAPLGFLNGFADYIRLTKNLDPPSWPRRCDPPSATSTWDEGYATTAFFFAFLEEQAKPPIPDFAFRLNRLLKDRPWSPTLIVEVAGRSIEILWSEYRRHFDPKPPGMWPIPILTLIHRDPDTKGGELFRKLIPDSEVYFFLEEICHNVLAALYVTPEQCPRTVRSLTVYVRNMEGVAYCVGERDKEIHLSTQHIENTHGTDPNAFAHSRTEIEGVLSHESVHVFQHHGSGTPGGLIEGIADLVRLHLGLSPPHWKKAARNRRWDGGYDTTAYFLNFIENDANPPTPDFTVLVNKKLGERGWRYTNQLFVDLTGKTVETLWKEYRASIEDENGPRGEDGWPEPKIAVVNREKEDKDGPVFSTVVPDDEAVSLFASVSRTVLTSLYGADGASASPGYVKSLTLIIRAMDGVAYCDGDTAKEIHLSTIYLRKVAKNGPEHLRKEIVGILVHEVTHAWQWSQPEVPGGLIEGVADWVRLVNAFEPPHWKREKGGNWDDGYNTTAYFLEWVEKSGKLGFVHRLNAALDSEEEWDEDIIKKLAGKSVNQLWKEYQRCLP